MINIKKKLFLSVLVEDEGTLHILARHDRQDNGVIKVVSIHEIENDYLVNLFQSFIHNNFTFNTPSIDGELEKDHTILLKDVFFINQERSPFNGGGFSGFLDEATIMKIYEKTIASTGDILEFLSAKKTETALHELFVEDGFEALLPYLSKKLSKNESDDFLFNVDGIAYWIVEEKEKGVN